MGRSGIFSAVKNNHPDMVAMLLCVGAKVDIHDCFFTFPIHVAVENRHLTMTQMLIKSNASVNVYDAQGRTPLMFAMDNNQPKVVRCILNEKPEVDIIDSRGWNIFIYATEKNLLSELGEVLLGFGDQVKLVVGWKDPQGLNALHHAIMKGNYHDVVLLCKILPCITAVDCNGNTTLHLAACEPNGRVLNHLLEFIFEGTAVDVGENSKYFHIKIHFLNFSYYDFRGNGTANRCTAALRILLDEVIRYFTISDFTIFPDFMLALLY
jgi:ankyrin repeat protein